MATRSVAQSFPESAAGASYRCDKCRRFTALLFEIMRPARQPWMAKGASCKEVAPDESATTWEAFLSFTLSKKHGRVAWSTWGRPNGAAALVVHLPPKLIFCARAMKPPPPRIYMKWLFPMVVPVYYKLSSCAPGLNCYCFTPSSLLTFLGLPALTLLYDFPLSHVVHRRTALQVIRGCAASFGVPGYTSEYRLPRR